MNENSAISHPARYLLHFIPRSGVTLSPLLDMRCMGLFDKRRPPGVELGDVVGLANMTKLAQELVDAGLVEDRRAESGWLRYYRTPAGDALLAEEGAAGAMRFSPK